MVTEGPELERRNDTEEARLTTSQSLADRITEFASQITEGFIVELGSFHGKGTIALAKEAKVKVYSIDDWQEKHGWIGERYGPEDEEIYWANIKEAGLEDKIIQLDMPFEEAAEQWQWDIGLLYWDPGMMGRFRRDFADWSGFICENGIFIAKDTAQGHLGTFPIILSAIKLGTWERFDYQSGVSFLRRLV